MTKPRGLLDLRDDHCPNCGEDTLVTNPPEWEDAEVVTIRGECKSCGKVMSIVFHYHHTNVMRDIDPNYDAPDGLDVTKERTNDN
jgi:rRNA maturation protein Nop10